MFSLPSQILGMYAEKARSRKSKKQGSDEQFQKLWNIKWSGRNKIMNTLCVVRLQFLNRAEEGDFISC